MCSFIGYVTDEEEAEILIDAVDNNLILLTPSRLTLKQQQQIKSGSVYIYKPSDAKITRWTDGKNWSYSKEFRNLLFYWELNTLPLSVGDTSGLGVKRGDYIYGFKQGGLVKATMKVMSKGGEEYKIISYFTREDIANGCLFPPSYYFKI